MSTLALTLAPPRERRRARLAFQAACALGGSLLIAVLAQVSIPLPFTPVPVTGQTFGVLLLGAALGPELAAITLSLYLAEGAIGLPFFAQGSSGLSLLGASSATGGYLWGFLAAASLIGFLARRGWDRDLRGAIGALFLGEVVIYAVGVPWLMAAVHVPLEKGLALGLYPFVVGDALKLLLAAALLPTAWKLTGGRRD